MKSSTQRGISALTIPRSPDVIDRVLSALGAALEGGPAVLPLPAVPAAVRESLVDALRPDEPLEADAALVVPTSGSTGEPKGVLLSAGAIRASAEATHARLGGVGRWLLALPATHVAGLMVLTRSVVAGTTPVALDLTEGFDPEAFAAVSVRLLGGSSGRRYTALVATQLAAVLATGSCPAEALAAYDAVLLGGSGVRPDLLSQARDAGVRVVTTYGMTETCGGCVYDGVPLDGVKVEIDASASGSHRGSAPLQCTPRGSASYGGALQRGETVHTSDRAESCQGMIRLCGPMLASGYRLQPELTRQAFDHGWFTTADLGSIDGDGVLHVHGRADDVAISGGVNVPLAAVDAAVTDHPDVADAAAVAVDDPTWGHRVVAAAVPRDPRNPPTLESIRTHVGRRHPAAYVPKELVLVESLPMLPTGKVDRRALRTEVSGS
jgi:O-succinylbenzoic acid--CoA ligase